MRGVLTSLIVATSLCATTSADVFHMGGGLTSLETVPVGHPGNAPDTELMNDGTTGYGSVSYEYKIGKYEVTAGQYTEFLNAVATMDPNGLYNTDMESSVYGCKILRSGSGIQTDPYSYTIAPEYADRPVNYVSFWDACRFANWLHNGQSNGDTETGAYTLTSSGIANNTVIRNANWTWAVTSEDEWYKAAYHQNDGLTGNYWDYPTGSQTIPTAQTPPGGTNSANTFWAVGHTTDVGAYAGSASPYGTFDQGGNVWEWNDTVIDGAYRGLRGGSFGNPDYSPRASDRDSYHDPAGEDTYVFGFRVVESVPEPATLGLLALGGLAVAKRRRKSATIQPSKPLSRGLIDKERRAHKMKTTRLLPILATVCCAAGVAAADPVIPGKAILAYASPFVSTNGLSFDKSSGVLYVGNDNYDGGPQPIYRIPKGGGTPIAFGDGGPDPDPVLYDDVGFSGIPGAVLTGGWHEQDGQVRGYIRAVLPDGTSTTLYDSTAFRNPADLAFDSQGALIFTDMSAPGRAFRASSRNIAPSLLITLPSWAENVNSIAIASNGEMYISTAANGRILRYAADGTLITDSFATGLSGYVGSCFLPIAFGPGGAWGNDLYVLSGTNLLRYDSSSISSVVGTGFTSSYSDMTFGPDGFLYIADDAYMNGRILQVVPEPLTVSLLALGGMVLIRRKSA